MYSHVLFYHNLAKCDQLKAVKTLSAIGYYFPPKSITNKYFQYSNKVNAETA